MEHDQGTQRFVVNECAADEIVRKAAVLYFGEGVRGGQDAREPFCSSGQYSVALEGCARTKLVVVNVDMALEFVERDAAAIFACKLVEDIGGTMLDRDVESPHPEEASNDLEDAQLRIVHELCDCTARRYDSALSVVQLPGWQICLFGKRQVFLVPFCDGCLDSLRD